eukprot:Rmarinus@m.3765
MEPSLIVEDLTSPPDDNHTPVIELGKQDRDWLHAPRRDSIASVTSVVSTASRYSVGRRPSTDAGALPSSRAAWLTAMTSARQKPSGPSLIDKDMYKSAVAASQRNLSKHVATDHTNRRGVDDYSDSAPSEAPVLIDEPYAKLGPVDTLREWIHKIKVMVGSEDLTEFGDETKDPLPSYLYSPDSTQLVLRDFVFLVLIVYAFYDVTYRYSFDHYATGTLKLFNLIIDVIWLWDVTIRCRTSYINEIGQLETDIRKVLLAYLKTKDFFLDFLGAIPWDLITGYNELVLIKLFRLHRFYEKYRLLMEIFEATTAKTLQLQILRMMGVVLLLIHLTACGWYLSASIGSTGDESFDDNWLEAYWGETEISHSARYITSLYWAVSTITTVAYGDVTPVTTREMVTAMVFMCTGGYVFAFIVGNMTSIIAAGNRRKMIVKDKRALLHEYLHYRQLPPSLANRIHKYCEFRWRNTVFDEDSVLDELSSSLRFEVIMHLSRDLILNVPFFRGADETFLRNVVPLLRCDLVAPGDTVFDYGAVGLEMYIIRQGQVEVLDKEGLRVATIGTGGYFGEVAFVQHEVRRTATVRSVTYCELYTLSKVDLDKAVKYFPAIREKLDAMAEMILRRGKVETSAQNGRICLECGAVGAHECEGFNKNMLMARIADEIDNDRHTDDSDDDGDTLANMEDFASRHTFERVRRKSLLSAMDTSRRTDELTAMIEAQETSLNKLTEVSTAAMRALEGQQQALEESRLAIRMMKAKLQAIDTNSVSILKEFSAQGGGSSSGFNSPAPGRIGQSPVLSRRNSPGGGSVPQSPIMSRRNSPITTGGVLLGGPASGRRGSSTSQPGSGQNSARDVVGGGVPGLSGLPEDDDSGDGVASGRVLGRTAVVRGADSGRETYITSPLVR